MKAVVIERFGQLPSVQQVPDPACPPDGVVLRVLATGLCRSDWHGWRGHDPDVRLPHVPGHELSGEIVEVGREVTGHRVGARVTVPFVCACGRCAACLAGEDQVCIDQEQPGFTHWGSFAEFVALHRADHNLVPLPERLPMDVAAVLGCRVSTAFRAVVQQGNVQPGEWVAVHGCGGVGLSAVMIAAAYGARVVAVDPSPSALELSQELGAEAVVDARDSQVVQRLVDITAGGPSLSLDAIGHPSAYANSLQSLRFRGRHVQVGLLPPEQSTPPLPVPALIARELSVLGSHGMAARHFPALLGDIAAGRLRLERLIRDHIPLAAAPAALQAMDEVSPVGMTVIEPNG